MLNNVKILLGITDNSKDELLSLMIDEAIEEVVNYTHNNDTAGIESTICRMVVYKYNRSQNDGIDSESYSGVSFNYSTDYPESIMRVLNARRKVILL
jgi:hypothetical protein